MTELWVELDEIKSSIAFGPFPRGCVVPLSGGRTLDLMASSDDDLLALGLLRFITQGADYDPVASIRIEPTIHIDIPGATVTASYNYVDRDLTDAQSILTDRINTYRDAVLENGWLFNGIRYDSDDRSVQNMAGTQTMINAGFTLPPDFVWRASDNTDHPFTNQSFLAFFVAAAQWREAAFRAAWVHKANVLAMTSVHDIAAYDFTTGWVKGFTVDQNGMTPVV